MTISPEEFVLTVAKSIRDKDGNHPEPAQVERELAVRCIDLMARLRESERENEAYRMRIMAYEGRP